jgi:excisionase family DNA binding protein
MTSEEQLAVSIPKAADLLDCSSATVRRAIERGEIRAVRLLGKVIVPMVELERLLGVERPKPAPQQLVDAFARLVGVTETA